MDEPTEVVGLGDAGAAALGEGMALGRATAATRWRSGGRPHAHAFHQVTLLLADPGAFGCRVDGVEVFDAEARAGRVLVCPAFVPVAARAGSPPAFVSVRIDPGRFGRIAAGLGRGPGLRRPTAFRDDPFAREVLLKLADRPAIVPGTPDPIGDSLGVALVGHLLEAYGAAEPGPPAARDAWAEALGRVAWYVDVHLDGDVSVARLAAVAGLSPYHFARRFRAATGTSPHQFVVRRRVERARDLLLGGATIVEAAALVGFSGQSHLHHHFRRLLGITPGDCRRGRGRDDGRPR